MDAATSQRALDGPSGEPDKTEKRRGPAQRAVARGVLSFRAFSLDKQRKGTRRAGAEART